MNYFMVKRDNEVEKNFNSIYKCIDADICSELKQGTPRDYIQFGIMRRLLMVESSYKYIIQSARRFRNTYLSYEEVQYLSKEINLIYINCVGILDNLCWVYIYEKLPCDQIENYEKKPMSVCLSKLFCDESKGSFIKEIKEIEKNWDIKDKRNPIAHRWPFYIPPDGMELDDNEIDKFIIFHNGEERNKYYVFPDLLDDIEKLIKVINIILTKTFDKLN